MFQEEPYSDPEIMELKRQREKGQRVLSAITIAGALFFAGLHNFIHYQMASEKRLQGAPIEVARRLADVACPVPYFCRLTAEPGIQIAYR